MLKTITAVALLIWFVIGVVIAFHGWEFAALKIESMGAPMAGVLAVLAILLVIPGIAFGWLGAVEFGGYEHWEVVAVLFVPQAAMLVMIGVIGAVGAAAAKFSAAADPRDSI